MEPSQDISPNNTGPNDTSGEVINYAEANHTETNHTETNHTETNPMTPTLAATDGPNLPPWLEQAAAQLLTTLGPQADSLDHQPEALTAALQWLGQQGWLALKVPVEWGGKALNEEEYGWFREQLARCSGALAFLQAQHQTAAALIASGDNDDLKTQYLPAIARGDRQLGIAFSHLRRADDPPIEGRAVAGGWEVTGTAPWVTGVGHFPEAVLAVPTAAGVLFGIVPLTAVQSGDRNIQPEPPMVLGAMNATQTAAVTFDRWLIPEAAVIGLKPIDWIQQLDRRNALQGVYFALGCTQAALDRLTVLFQEKRLLTIAVAHDTLRREFDQLRQQVYGRPIDKPYAQKLQLRAQAIALMGRATQAALVAQGGRGILATNPAYRLQGEASIFATSGQTPDILVATLGAIVGKSPTALD